MKLYKFQNNMHFFPSPMRNYYHDIMFSQRLHFILKILHFSCMAIIVSKMILFRKNLRSHYRSRGVKCALNSLLPHSNCELKIITSHTAIRTLSRLYLLLILTFKSRYKFCVMIFRATKTQLISYHHINLS